MLRIGISNDPSGPRLPTTCLRENGTLAGTALDMAGAVRNAVSLLGVDIVEAARMASQYPAEFLGLGAELGRIEPGYRANLVLVDDQLTVQQPGSRAPRASSSCA
jgi:N-acetylglucosamine-6-phosphate deacetylase